MKKAFIVILAFVVLIGMWSCSKSSSSSGGTTYSVTMAPVQSTWPIVREASGQWEIVGEGMFKNTGTETLTISAVSLKVFNANGDVLADRSYGPGKFNDMIMIVLMSPNGNYTQTSPSTSELKPTDLGFCHVAALAGNSSLPTRATISVNFSNGKSETTEVQLYEFDPGQQTIWPARLSAGDWVAFTTAESDNQHWKDIGINSATGVNSNSECFAIDFLRVDAQGRLSNPSGSLNKEDYYSWGEDILSAGTGTVVAVEKTRLDQSIGSSDQNYPGGNYVLIQHGPKLFSFYTHMMYSSATVSVGDTVVTGQVIGRIGSSGSAPVPHVHFQYMDDKGKGLPALFWGARVNRLSDADLLSILGQVPDFLNIVVKVPDIREQNYLLTAGTYTMNGTMPLQYDIVTAP